MIARSTPSTRQGTTGIVVEGLDVVATEFRLRADRIRPEAAETVVDYAARAAQLMRDRVPIDQGDLLDSITSDKDATRTPVSVYADAGPDPKANRGAFKGPLQEHGTINHGPQPFVAPAADDLIRPFERALRNLR